jgi:ferric-dicitrate binding protein FerR (iron transport regulator)
MKTRTEEIIQNYMTHHQPDEVTQQFADWLSTPCNREAKDSVMQKIWSETDARPDATTHEAYRRWLTAMLQKARKRHRASTRCTLRRIAAILTPLIMLAAGTHLLLHKAESEIKFVECSAPQGQTRTVTLPDSSTIHLNAGTILIYPQKFTATRRVYINGEACLHVAHISGSPFTVKTADLEVQVTGTIFNVNTRDIGNNTTVTLAQGSVNVRLAGDSRTTTLKPDEQFLYNRTSGAQTTRSVHAPDILAWTQGTGTAKSMQLVDLARLIEQNYSITVHLDSARYADERITIKLLKDEDLLKVMSTLKLLVPAMKYKIENNNLYIY